MKKFQPFHSDNQFLCFCLLFLLPALVLGKCPCDTESKDDNKSEAALKYKIAAIASILVAGAIGVCLPVLGKTIEALRPEKNLFFIIKAFAAGVILSTGFIHVLPDAFERLTNPCLSENPWRNFPFTGFVAMVAAIGTLMVDAFATSYYQKYHLKHDQPVKDGDEENSGEHAGHVPVHTHGTHGHVHGSVLSLAEGEGSSELIRHRVISQVLELGIVVHSVIIGISLGASQSLKTVRAWVAALTFHQFFEGMGLGGCISQAKFKSRATAIMAIFFSLTTPVGIAIGIILSKGYENSLTAIAIEGILNAASAGILIYMALVNLLAADFMNPRMQTNGKLQIEANVSLLLGAGLMSLLAIWA